MRDEVLPRREPERRGGLGGDQHRMARPIPEGRKEAHVSWLEGGLHFRPGGGTIGDRGQAEQAERGADAFGMDVDRPGAERGEVLLGVAGREAALHPQAGAAQQAHEHLREDPVLDEGLGADGDRGRRAAGEREQGRGET